MVAIDLRKQQALDADAQAIQQINFTANAVSLSLISQRSLIFISIKMTQYNSLNVKLSNSEFNKLEPAIKKETDLVLRLSSTS